MDNNMIKKGHFRTLSDDYNDVQLEADKIEKELFSSNNRVILLQGI
jgi:hypothetical protein